MGKKERKIDKKAFLEWFLVIITGIIINFLCVLIFSITSHAESLYFPMQQNANNGFPEVVQTAIDNRFDSGTNYIFFWTNDINNDGWTRGWVGVIPKATFNDDTPLLFGEINSNGYQFSLYKGSQFNIACYKVNANRSTGLLGVTNLGNNQNVFSNMTSSIYSSSFDYISNFKIYTNNNQDREVVLKYGPAEPEPSETGHATHPHFDGLHPHYGNTVTPPDEVPPTYTINNYSWTTYNNPPVDNSSTNALLESIFDILSYNSGYLQTNISNEFDNLILNIKGLVDYLGETLQYYGDLIIANIQNGIQNFYDNMVSLVEPIYEKISDLQNKLEEFADLFINPFDKEEFEEQIDNSSFFTNYNAIIDNCEEISEIFDYAEERDHFSLYISFENPFEDSEHRIISSEINFDWLVPLRSVYRPFIWVCVLIELFIGGAKVLTRIIGGHGLG